MSEIIINDIDVSECKLYDYGICDSEMAEDLNCEKNPDCYFKQLKHLQKENEELKADLKAETEQAQKWYQRETDKHFVAIKYKQALEEISILAKNYCNACDEFKAKTLKNKNDCLYCNYGFIRRKINEVFKNET